jgi:hypothetical protein
MSSGSINRQFERVEKMKRILFGAAVLAVAIVGIYLSTSEAAKPRAESKETLDEIIAGRVAELLDAELKEAFDGVDVETQAIRDRLGKLEGKVDGQGGRIATSTSSGTVGLWVSRDGLESNSKPEVAIYCQKTGVGETAVVGAYGNRNKGRGVMAALVASDRGMLQLVDVDGSVVHVTAADFKKLVAMVNGPASEPPRLDGKRPKTFKDPDDDFVPLPGGVSKVPEWTQEDYDAEAERIRSGKFGG